LRSRRAKFVCFLGPSGCGKTTLLRAIAGLDIQSTGRIWQAGRDISALPSSQRDFGIVFQSYALFPTSALFDNIGYGLKNAGKSRGETAARVWNSPSSSASRARTQVSEPAFRRQQQRVALARALAMSPGLLLPRRTPVRARRPRSVCICAAN